MSEDDTTATPRGLAEDTLDEQVSRITLMAAGDPTWDLSPKDCAALAAILAEREELLSVMGHIYALSASSADKVVCLRKLESIRQAVVKFC